MTVAPEHAARPAGDCRVGIDMIAVHSVEEALAAHGERYLRRIFTEHELETCRTPQGLSTASLAARWAAKEATIKMLAPAQGQPEWTTMEVRRSAGGAPALELSGTAATLAAEAGITSLALSMTHEGPFAAAVVFALCSTVPAPHDPHPGSHDVGGRSGDFHEREGKEQTDA